MALESLPGIDEASSSVQLADESLLSREQLIEFYRLMYLSRRTDDREIVLKRQQKIFFQISCAGHEARSAWRWGIRSRSNCCRR